MKAARPDITEWKLDRFADLAPEIGWNTFQLATLVLLHELRERARTMRELAAAKSGDRPEDAADEVLNQVRHLGAQAGVDSGLVEMTLEGIQAALYRHVTAPGRWGSWAAVQNAAQEAADEVAVTVDAIADGFVETREVYRRTTKDEDAAEIIASLDRLIGMLRAMVATVRVAGGPARA